MAPSKCKGLAKRLENFRDFTLPFEIMPSFAPVFDFIQTCDGILEESYQSFLKDAILQFKNECQAKGLNPTDPETIKKNKNFLTSMENVLLPLTARVSHNQMVTSPFCMDPVLVTPKFEEQFIHHDGTFAGRVWVEGDTFQNHITAAACRFILSQIYDIQSDNEQRIVFCNKESESSLIKYYYFELDPFFIRIISKGAPKELSNEDRSEIKQNLDKADILLKHIKPDGFRFEGLLSINAVDVTQNEIISALKNYFFGTKSVEDEHSYLSGSINTLLGRSDLDLNIYAFKNNKLFETSKTKGLFTECIVKEHAVVFTPCSNQSIMTKAMKSRDVIIIDNLKHHTPMGEAEEYLLKKGANTVIICPLFDNDQPVGLVILTSPVQGAISRSETKILQSVMSFFSIAVSRNLSRFDESVQKFIRERFTAIHPSLQWKFEEVAASSLHDSSKNHYQEIPQIAFRDVHPLFAASDIRNSSILRNQAIQKDLTMQLKLARSILETAYTHRKMPFLKDLIFQTQTKADTISRQISAGDELAIYHFLDHELAIYFPILKTYHPNVAQRIEQYLEELDSNLNIVYHHRRLYENSVTLLNEVMAAVTNDEQLEAQKIYPHYFDSQMTDGVDHNIYLGKTLVPDPSTYSDIYLKNLRLWQLKLVCKLACIGEILIPYLPIEIQTAHIIVVQNAPLSIRFDKIEKKLVVDGAYNIRYEIMKKRIDKATAKGSGERLTMPGKVAIVFSQNSERSEYEKYIDYLRHEEFLTGEIEEFQLEDLQGIHGLRALRANINLARKHEGLKRYLADIKSSDIMYRSDGAA